LLLFWLQQTVASVFLVALFLQSSIAQGDDYYQSTADFIICVYFVPPGEDWEDYCEISDPGIPPFGAVVAFHVVIGLTPVILFIVLGFRKSLFRFWSEYVIHMWKNKKIVFPYDMSEDFSHSSHSTKDRDIDSSSQSTVSKT
jgi:hypothetical protein